MAAFPKFPLWTDAYLGDTTHLTTIEHGAYLLLLIAMWRSSGEVKSLPNDDKTLSRYCRLNIGQWRRIRLVLMPFFTDNGTVITQPRLTDEWEAVKRHSLKQSNNARHKYLKNNNTTSAIAEPKPSQINAPYPYPYPIKKDSPRVPRVSDENFNKFYSEFPKHVGRGAAVKALERALKRAPIETIVAGAKRYSEKVRKEGTETRFICHPSTWLNQERWLDLDGLNESQDAISGRLDVFRRALERAIKNGDGQRQIELIGLISNETKKLEVFNTKKV